MQEMKPEVLKALKSSIAHWERLAGGRRLVGEGVGPLDCALCRMFNQLHMGKGEARCDGCPVKGKTSQDFCYGSPFEEAQAIAEMTDDFDEPLDTAMSKEAAQKELDFLKSLLPKNE